MWMAATVDKLVNDLLIIGDERLLKPLFDLPPMADKAREMLHSALEAFVWRDVALARAIPEWDSARASCS